MPVVLYVAVTAVAAIIGWVGWKCLDFIWDLYKCLVEHTHAFGHFRHFRIVGWKHCY